eukprot:COSAG06_NODE_3396_length_5405_cov_6.327554_2_plen_298_part_00
MDRSGQWTQACNFACEAVRRYWDEHSHETFDNRMQGREPWPPCPGSGDPDAAVEVMAAMRDDGYIARRAQDAILGCPAGVAFQHAAMLVTQLIADRRPAPTWASALASRPRDEVGQIIDASNAAHAAAEAADLAAQMAPPPSAARDAARAERAAQCQAAQADAQGAGMTADEVIDAVIAAPNAWRRRVHSVAAVQETASAVANGGPVTQLQEDSDSVAAADAGELSPVRSVTAQGSEEAAGAVANGGPVTQLEEDGGSVAAADAGELAADATPSPPVTRSAMRAAAAAAAQRRVSSG